ncbi:MAG: twin-arginine translocation signal domain-containing protein [FCB group bacterium]|jgi:hypothetical protein|nr:twin-arginine translocation signal domain-containing protein [FCB group bacterium]
MSNGIDRRDFLKRTAAVSVGAALYGSAMAQETAPKTPGGDGMIWANLLHLGFNMWVDWDYPEGRENYTNASSTLRFDEPLWNDLVDKMAESGLNMVVIDLGEGVRYDSHPELAVEGSWEKPRVKEMLAKLRAKGLEPIPKMNFSATHDHWLGPFSRCLSTDAYYGACKDLIAEAVDLFDKPRFFHLGMDEETAQHQKRQLYTVIRQYDLWWKDFLFLVEQVEKGNSRPWIWSDYIWEHKDVFLKRMPKSVVQSNWYYGNSFDREKKGEERYVGAYHELAEAGYDQIPTGSNWSHPENFGMTVDYVTKNLPQEHILGFLQTPWKPTLEACRERHFAAIEQVRDAKAKV